MLLARRSGAGARAGQTAGEVAAELSVRDGGQGRQESGRSGSSQKRLMLGTALAMNAARSLLDEPFGADPAEIDTRSG